MTAFVVPAFLAFPIPWALPLFRRLNTHVRNRRQQTRRAKRLNFQTNARASIPPHGPQTGRPQHRGVGSLWDTVSVGGLQSETQLSVQRQLLGPSVRQHQR